MADDQKGLFTPIEPERNGNGRKLQRLFVPKLLREAADNRMLRGAAFDKAHAILIKWAELESSGKLRTRNESQVKGEFLSEVFGEALGYSLFSQGLQNWNFDPEYEVGGQTADGAIGFFPLDPETAPRVLVEIKGPRINVDRDRSNGRTPVRQLFDYLIEAPACPWGIVCNCVSFRLYHREKTTRVYEQYTLQELRDEKKFREFYCLFERGAFLPLLAGQQPRADSLLVQSAQAQREVGGKLYALYHDQRIALIRHLRRPPHGLELNQAIHAAQKLLDRIIFIAFCEDRRLLPPKSIERTWNSIRAFELDENPRWRSFLQLFKSVDRGNRRELVNAFNGELFKENLVDNLELNDDWTNFFRDIAEYDFQDEVNVDVLGRLFEQSITDLEEFRKSPDAPAAPAVQAKPGRRKREGVYYTPPHITKFIVKHTLGPTLNDRFAALAKELGLDLATPPAKRIGKTWARFHHGQLDILKRLRVCDPACGSGAFLIEAFEFLEDEYEKVIEDLIALEELKESALDGVSATILQENLFGVDLSPEAVEITKLALWIRTAEINKPLSNLSGNIRCGNSVVDDPAVDERAFDWAAQFPQVFAEGKFDCVIGNPPYVKLQNFRQHQPRIAEFLVDHYRSAKTGNFDLYLPFIERGLELLKPTGRLGMIAPNVWLFNEYGRGLRELVAERKCLERFVDFKSHQVFDDATTYTALQFFSASACEVVLSVDASSGDLSELAYHEILPASLGSAPWALVGKTDQQMLDKMREGNPTLGEVTAQIFQGLITSADSIYHLTQIGPGKFFSKSLKGVIEIEEDVLRPLVSGNDAVPFATPPTDTYLIFPYKVTDDECRLMTASEMQRYRRCWKYLKEHEAKLRARENNSFDDDAWYRFGRNQNIDKQHLPKLGVPQTVSTLAAFNDVGAERFFNNVRINGILAKDNRVEDLWAFLAIMNSRALDFYFRQTAKPKDRGYFEANKQFIAPLPVPRNLKKARLGELSKRLSKLHEQRLTIEAGVHRRFQVDLPPKTLLTGQELPPSIPKKLQAFDDLTIAEAIPALEKFAKRKFPPKERAEWDQLLTAQTSKLVRIKQSIADAMHDLNDRVYRLFQLTPDEIKLLQREVEH